MILELITFWSADNEDPNHDGRWSVDSLWYNVSVKLFKCPIVVNQDQMLLEGNVPEDSIARYLKGSGEVVITRSVNLVIHECHGCIAER